MKYVYANLKRFDVRREEGGINSMAAPAQWGEYIVSHVQEGLSPLAGQLEAALFLPEAHIIPAAAAKKPDGFPVRIGCQGVFRRDVAKGGNFGAFTTSRTAKSMAALGCDITIIGHCEERIDKREIMAAAGANDEEAISRILNAEIRCAVDAGLTVLYCVGERAEEQEHWDEVIRRQLTVGLEGVDLSRVRIAYEPVWAIGPGRPVPGREDIRKVACLSKELFPQVPFLYGGGLKTDNAGMLASIDEVDGGLVGLTRFTGEIGFYPDGFIEIIRTYLG
ncbi:MAG: triose-phosphate isomerase [Oscillospiraceae bacterium]|nr:MAG: triose-phosphate isomerase [Oscillospiraceae bacterium]